MSSNDIEIPSWIKEEDKEAYVVEERTNRKINENQNKRFGEVYGLYTPLKRKNENANIYLVSLVLAGFILIPYWMIVSAM